MARKTTVRYYDIASSSTSSYEDVLKKAKKLGYNYILRWVNSDLNWTYFQTTSLKAQKAAVELYFQERGKDMNISKKDAINYYHEFVDVISVEQELADL